MLFLQDLRLSLRALKKSPAFTLTAALSLAIGLGATTTVFTFVNAFFLRSLPGVEAQDRLLHLHQQAQGEPLGRFSKPTYDDLDRSRTVFSNLAAFTDRGFNLDAGGRTDLVVGQLVSGSYFATLGIEPALGRLLGASDDRVAGGHPVVVLSHRLWHRRFGADPQIIGSSLRLNGDVYTVAGVAEEGFQGTFIGFAAEVFVPLAMLESAFPMVDLEDRQANLVEIVGRLRDGISAEQAAASLQVVARQLGRDIFPDQPRYGLDVAPVTGFDESIRQPVATLVFVLFAVAALVLVIACVNVANMLLVRAAARGREIVVRLALGAPRRRVISQLLNESLLLALLGGALGLLVTLWAVDALQAFDPSAMTAISLVLDFRLDREVLLFAMALSMSAGLLFGLAPALQATRPDLASALSSAAPDATGKSRLRSVFVVGQIALTLLLLVAAGLFLKVLGRAAATHPGFEAATVLAATVDSSLLRLASDTERQAFHDRLLTALRRESLFESVTLTRSVPLTFGRSRIEIDVDGHLPATGQEGFEVDAATIAPDYFTTLAIPVIGGRDITSRDRQEAPRVALVNASFAARFFPDGDAIGQRFRRAGESIEVVGLAADSKVNALTEPPTPLVYLPLAQTQGHRVTILARYAADSSSASAITALRNTLRAFEPELPILSLMPMSRMIGFSLLPQKIAGTVATALAVIALLLAAFGVYGVVAFSANRRGRELGVRASLGARRRDLSRLIIGDGLRLVALGVGVGLAVSLPATHLLGSLLVGVSPNDPWTFIVIVGALAAVSLLASYLPARRAARIDPLVSLRRE
ncbi:MAG: ABC transporter permease [Acidobacteriota bacterium]